MSHEDVIDRFVHSYSHVEADNLISLASLYHEDFLFEDPLQVCNGWHEYYHHLKSMYQNTEECRFIIKGWISDAEQGYLQWTLTFRHPKLFSGLQQDVEGCTRLEFQEGRVTYQRDYFDCGEMIYEGIPLFGACVKAVKRKVIQTSSS